MRDSWVNSNFDRTLLKFYTNESGFILGESKLGDMLGIDGADVEIDATFTSINVTHSCSVESGLFVHRNVSVCEMTATLPSYIDLMKKRISIRYGSLDVFKGTVQEVNWTESRNDGRYWMPGNTDTKTYSVSLTITAGDEDFSEAGTPGIDFFSTQLQSRVGQWLGLTYDATWSDPDNDLGRDLYDNIELIGSTDRVINATDDMGALADTLREQLKIMSMHFVYKPWESKVYVRNNNRWHYSPGNDEAGSIMFSDDSADDTGIASDGYLHSDRHVIYSSREFGYEPGFYQGSVQIKTTFSAVEHTFGPYRSNEVRPSDPVVDLGVQWIDGGDKLPRNYVSTLPLKRSSQPFTKGITMPLQSTLQIIGSEQVPGMALLKHDGVTERVAVLGVKHTITPDLWIVDYDLGPHHLLDRQGDFDPSLPKGLSFTDDGAVTGTVRFKILTPETRPTDVNLYAYVYTGGNANKDNISWSSDIVVRKLVSIDSYGDEAVMPTSVTYYSTARPTTPGVYDYYVAITSDPNPGSGVVNHQYRQSQPQLMGTVVVT